MSGEPIDPARRLPEEWLFLCRLHPRAGWNADVRTGELGRFWLARHRLFRTLGGELAALVERLRSADRPEPVVRELVPRLQFYLGELDGHHRIEDQHYFPQFQRAEPRLARGFALLDADHHALETAIGDVVGSVQAMLRAIEPERRAAEREIAAHAGALDRLMRGLDRHLDDEEDLVIPLLIARGGA